MKLLSTGPQDAACQVLLAHGAGAPMDSASMNAVAMALAAEGLLVHRFEFGYMAARRTGQRKPPPKAEGLRGEYLAAIEAVASNRPLIIGGKSMGGRVASMAADDLHARGMIQGLLCLGKGQSYPGEHAAIIDRDIWEKVHEILRQSPRQRAARTRAETPALLKGLLYGPDGAAFSPTHTRKGGRLYRYYVSQSVLKHGAGSCSVGRVPAGEIEAAVMDQLRAVFRQPEIIAGTTRAARSHDVFIVEADVRAALLQLEPLWEELFPAEQARIVSLLVERVDIGMEGLNIRLRLDGLNCLARELGAAELERAA